MQKLPKIFPSSDPGPIRFSTCGRRGAHGVAGVGTTSDYLRKDYIQILCCGRDIIVTIFKLKCQKQKVHALRKIDTKNKILECWILPYII